MVDSAERVVAVVVCSAFVPTTNGKPPDRRLAYAGAMTADVSREVRAAVNASFNNEWGRIVATLIGVTGDWDLTEECTQDAFARALLDSLAAGGALSGYHLLPAARADLLRRLGCRREAARCYREALELTSTGAERRFLSRRLAEAEG